jgi:hypothetical protein
MNSAYLVLCGHGEDIEEVIGPFESKDSARVAEQTIRQMSYNRGTETWGENDTWVRIEQRVVVE